MNVQSLEPFLLIAAPFALAFLLEAVVLYLFGIKRLWGAIGSSLLVNLLALAVLYGAGYLMGQLGYVFNGLRLPLQVWLALWWVSVLTDGLLLQAISPGVRSQRIYGSSLVMNTVSCLFLYFFIANTH